MSTEVKTKEKVDMDPKYIIKLTVTLLITCVVVAAALGCRCGSCFHVVWNQEREAAGLDQKMSEDTSSSVKVSVEALKLLIEADRKAGR